MVLPPPHFRSSICILDIALFLPPFAILNCDCTFFSVTIPQLGIAQKARNFLPLYFFLCTQLPCWVAKPQIQTLSRARCHGELLCSAGGSRWTIPPPAGQTKGRFGCFPKGLKNNLVDGKKFPTSGRLPPWIPGGGATFKVDEGWAAAAAVSSGGVEITEIGLKLGPFLLDWTWATQTQIGAA